MISALAAGNTLIVKPSEFAPKTSELINRMVTELFASDQVWVCQGGAEASKEILELPLDHIFFTGSTRVGKIVMEAAARHLTSVTLELGGKSPCIIDESADVKKAAKRVAWGKWLNAGQTCVAPDHLWIHEAVKESFLTELEKHSAMYDRQAYASIVNERHFDRLNEWTQEALNGGARLRFGGDTDKDQLLMQPAIMEEVSEEVALSKEEIFGPQLYVKTFSNIETVLSEINRQPKPLALYIFATKQRVIEQVTKGTTAGSMGVNDCVLQFSDPGMPFGGVNQSGIGKAHGKHGFKTFSNEKSVLRQRRGFSMMELLYPPYSGFKRFVIDFLIKYL